MLCAGFEYKIGRWLLGTWEHGNGGGGSREMVGTRGAGRKHEGLPNGLSGETGTCSVLSD